MSTQNDSKYTGHSVTHTGESDLLLSIPTLCRQIALYKWEAASDFMNFYKPGEIFPTSMTVEISHSKNQSIHHILIRHGKNDFQVTQVRLPNGSVAKRSTYYPEDYKYETYEK